MARVIKRVAAKRDLVDHFVFLGENASLEIAPRFLQSANQTFERLARMPEIGAEILRVVHGARNLEDLFRKRPA